MPLDTEQTNQAKLVSPIGARQYAQAKGWQRVATPQSARVFLLRHRTDPYLQLTIPIDSDFADYPLAIMDVAKRLSDVEERPLDSILVDLMMPSTDTIRMQFKSSVANSGSLPFGDALRLMNGARDTFLSVAHSVDHPQAFHPKLNRTEGREFLDACRFGQTERGSFVIKILCPINAVGVASAPFVGQPDADSLPFVRKATNLLMTSVGGIVNAIELDTVEQFLEVNRSNPVLSSNLCDSLLSMLTIEEDASITLAANWAPTLPQSPSASPPSLVSLRHDFCQPIEKMREYLRPSNEDREALYLGTVEELRGNADQSGQRSGEVIVSLLLPDDERISARVSLNAAQYTIADQAHMHQGRFVKIHGLLQRSTRLSRIVDLRDFELLDS